MNLQEINDENFRDVYQNNDIVILDFWAPWCGPCHQFAPIFEAVAKNHKEIVFGKVNTEEVEKLPLYFGIRSIPTTLVLRDSIEVFRHSGVLGEDDLKGIIEQTKTLDMSEVEKMVQEEEASNEDI